MNPTLETIHSLRSIHGGFNEKHISNEDFTLITDAAIRAANSSGRQFYSIIAVNDREKIKRTFNYEGDRALLFCIDGNRFIHAAERLGLSYEQFGIMSFITGSTDTVLAAQTAVIAAKSLGIDSLLTNSIHYNDIESIYREYNLPDTLCFPIIALILGYTDYEPDHKRGRYKGPGLFHEEAYHNMTSEEVTDMIEQYDDPDKGINGFPGFKSKGYNHFLEWFLTKWTQPVNKETEEVLKNRLEKERFMPFLER